MSDFYIDANLMQSLKQLLPKKTKDEPRFQGYKVNVKVGSVSAEEKQARDVAISNILFNSKA